MEAETATVCPMHHRDKGRLRYTTQSSEGTDEVADLIIRSSISLGRNLDEAIARTPPHTFERDAGVVAAGTLPPRVGPAKLVEWVSALARVQWDPNARIDEIPLRHRETVLSIVRLSCVAAGSPVTALEIVGSRKAAIKNVFGRKGTRDRVFLLIGASERGNQDPTNVRDSEPG